MENDGKITEQYEMKNSEESWNKFVGKYILEMPEIALEASTSGKHVARILRDLDFSVLIFISFGDILDLYYNILIF